MKEWIEKRGFWLGMAGSLLWILFIFWHSLQNGEDSSRESLGVWEIVRKILPGISHALLRKLGHLTEFAVLGALLSAAMGAKSAPLPLRRQPGLLRFWIFPVLTGLLVAVCDEWIQTAVPGRSGEIRDVLIDTAGALIGTALYALLRLIFGRKAPSSHTEPER